MVSRMSRRYPAGCEITDGWGKLITDEDPKNDDVDNAESDYNPAENDSDTSDPTTDTPNDNIP